jgi:fatty acid CoA ligase FadD9
VGGVTFNSKLYGNSRDVQLRDVPDMGYYLTDLPYPRGEVVVKSSTSAMGYYKDPAATAEACE